MTTTKVTPFVLANTAVTAGSYGGSSQLASIVVDAQGRITFAANNAASGLSIANTQITGIMTPAQGGLGISTTPSNGFIPIGNGTRYTAAAITGTANQVTVTNGAGTVTLSAPQDLGTASSVQHGSLGIGTAASGTSGEIRATNNVVAYFSDERLKTKLGVIENALSKLLTLNGFYYQPNEIAQALGYTVKKEVGLSAQEVQKVMPEIVVPAPIDEKYLTIHYDKLIPLLIEAIKELKQEVDELKNSK
jgi:hypothetical protein